MPKSAELTANVPENKDESRRRRPSRKHRSTAETARRRSRSKESLIGVKHAPGWRDIFSNSKKIPFWRRSPPVSPQSDSRASTASEGRGNGHKRKVRRRQSDASSTLQAGKNRNLGSPNRMTEDSPTQDIVTSHKHCTQMDDTYIYLTATFWRYPKLICHVVPPQLRAMDVLRQLIT